MSLAKNYKLISRVPVSKEVLPKIRVSKLMPEGHGQCARCGIEATSVVTYTLASEQHQVAYANIFAGRIMMTVDHILPRALGGADALSNLQLMCYKCNTKKEMMSTPQEMEAIMQNRDKHIRPSFKPHHMRYVIGRFPQLAPLYDLSEPEGPALPFKKTYFSQPTDNRMKRIATETDGLVNNQHPHHPMLGWARILKAFPDLKGVVRFT